MVTSWSYCYYWFRTWIISSKVYFDSFTIFFSYQLHLDLIFSYFYLMIHNFVPRYNHISRKTGNGARFRPCWYTFGISHFTSVMGEILRRMSELFFWLYRSFSSFHYFEIMRVLYLNSQAPGSRGMTIASVLRRSSLTLTVICRNEKKPEILEPIKFSFEKDFDKLS